MRIPLALPQLPWSCYHSASAFFRSLRGRRRSNAARTRNPESPSQAYPAHPPRGGKRARALSSCPAAKKEKTRSELHQVFRSPLGQIEACTDRNGGLIKHAVLCLDVKVLAGRKPVLRDVQPGRTAPKDY